MGQDKGITLKFPDGTFKTYPPNTPTDVMQADLQAARQKAGGVGSLFQPAPTIRTPAEDAAKKKAEEDYMNGPQPMKDAANLLFDALGMGTALIPGIGVEAAISRGALGSAINAGKAAFNGQNVGEAITDWANPMNLEVGGWMLGRALPWLGYKSALTLGGVRGEKDATVDAFMRQRDRMPVGQAPVAKAGEKKIVKQITKTGQALEAAEKAGGQPTKLRDVSGYTSNQFDKAKNASNPLDLRKAAGAHEQRTLEQQAVARSKGGTGTAADLAKMKEDDAVLAAYGYPSHYVDDAINATQLDVRDLGEMKRTAASRGRDVIGLRKDGAYIPAGEMENAQTEAALAHHLQGLQMNAADDTIPVASLGKRTQRRAIADANAELSDLFNIQEANKLLRGGGGVMTDIGTLGVRGGFGAGTASNIAGLGLGPSQGGLLRSVLGLLAAPLFAPSSISRIGSGAGRLGRSLNFLDKASTFADSADKNYHNYEKKKVQKRSLTFKKD